MMLLRQVSSTSERQGSSYDALKTGIKYVRQAGWLLGCSYDRYQVRQSGRQGSSYDALMTGIKYVREAG
jgi:hypothetical protein